ncbi:M23 family peptidase [Leptospira ognonensis]|uniref:M23 family peptidase n=2 Tax=Leptospira ognonensis TaxID=2484945 RepID=A0A4R9K1M1_9LEPT|nr:M23 family peptidase [Leptospira ognonensis]
MNMKNVLSFQVILFLFLSFQESFAEGKIPGIPKEEVGFPLPYYSPVTGTFAEIRNHNLHLGSDFKSYGLNGHSILATFDGYVEEINYSKIGYGLSLNFHNPTHKIKSKYAHLHTFGGELYDLELLRQALFLMGEKEGFSLKLPSNMFPAKKGVALGKTGESGSGISHLHLEFRTDKGIVNPLYFPDLHQKDVTPPTILSMLIESDSLTKPLLFKAKEIAKGEYTLLDENEDVVNSISLSGKVKIRISGYDIIRSRNKNNVYGMDLFLNEKEIFRRNFDFLSFEEGSKKHQFYDVNRSSLSPPVYFYHLYEQPKNWKEEGYSFDLTEFPVMAKAWIEAGLVDATGNRSKTKLLIINEASKLSDKLQKPAGGKKVFSTDKVVSFDVSQNESTGMGSVSIVTFPTSEEIPLNIPKGLVLRSKIYHISAQNFTWKGEGHGEFLPSPGATAKDALYFWDESIRKFSSIRQKRKGAGFQFFLGKLGYVMVLEDHAPPYIAPMTSLARHIELPEVRSSCFEDRFYVLGDSGTGFKTNVELLLDGQPYPYEYDPDRTAIRVTLPKSLYKEKPYLLLEARAFDFAGNESEPFLDLIATSGWKKDSYASCPLIE